jgi:hypothetical protein
VQEATWEYGSTEPAGEYVFFYGKCRIISAVKRVKSVSDRMSYVMLRSHWCYIIVLNVHAPTEDKIDDVKDSFYEELDVRSINSLTPYEHSVREISVPK